MKSKEKGLLDRELEDPVRRKRFEAHYEGFKLEVQILAAMEKKGWSYADLARALGAHKSNISRDLRAGKINSATITRLTRIGEVLGLRFVPVFVPARSGKGAVEEILRIANR